MTNLAKSTKVDTSYKQIIQLSAPIWISILITQISFATNNYFLGHVGKSQLAANGVGSIFNLNSIKKQRRFLIFGVIFLQALNSIFVYHTTIQKFWFH